MKKTILAMCCALTIFSLASVDAKAAEIDPSPLVVTYDEETGERDTDVVMPTVDNLDGNAKKYNYLVSGTDQYNDIFVKVGNEYGIDPVFLKVIMSVESCGVLTAKNGCHIGPYQISTSFGFDSALMTTDVEYATRACCEVINIKAADLQSRGFDTSIYYVAKWYNGGSAYAKKVSSIYEDLTEGSRDVNVYVALR